MKKEPKMKTGNLNQTGKELSEDELKKVNGGISPLPADMGDYEVSYSTDGESQSVDKPTDAGTYQVKIVIDEGGNYKA